MSGGPIDNPPKVVGGGSVTLAGTDLDRGLLDLLRPLRSLAVAIIGRDGATIDCNEGFRLLVESDGGALDAVAALFVNPTFAEMLASAADGGGIPGGRITVGRREPLGLVGGVHQRGGVILFAAEHDVTEQQDFSIRLLALNDQLTSLQRELMRANRDIARKEREMQRIAYTDALTGLPNRRAAELRLASEVERARRYGRPLCVALADIDLFKPVNDDYGHAVGDAVLEAIGAVLQAQSRKADFVARWGGEEFVFALPETAVDGAVEILDRLRCRIATLDVPPLPASPTVSIGVTALAAEDDVDALLRRADEALYAAKEGGRDRVVPCPAR